MTNAEVMIQALANATGKPGEHFKKILDAVPEGHRKDLDQECKDADKLLKRFNTPKGKRAITNWLLQGVKMARSVKPEGKYLVYTGEEGGRMYTLDPIVHRWSSLPVAVKNRPSEAMEDVTLLLHLISVLVAERQEALEFLAEAEEKLKEVHY